MSLEEDYLFKNDRKRRRFNWRSLLVALIGAVIGGLIVVLFVPYLLGSNPIEFFSARPKTIIKVKPKEEIISGKFFLDPVVGVAKVAGPSVVTIKVTQTRFNFFMEPTRQTAEGSGVVYRSDGYIITNNHVVERARKITVVFPNGSSLDSTIVGRDPITDIAVVKVKKLGLAAAKLGDSSELQVGELAVAIGSPFELQHTVTAGVISALKRNLTVPNSNPHRGEGTNLLENLIQTDAAINPGNSGGALCNEKGEVIGIPSVIFTPSSGNVGIGFAIPINDAKIIAEQLIKKGKASHPWLGIGGISMNPEIAKQIKAKTDRGILVAQVFKGQPADLAGIKPNDIITALDGKKVGSMDQLIASVRDKQVGDEVRVTVFRKNAEITIKLKLGEMPKNVQLQQ